MNILLPQIRISRGEVVHHLDALLQGEVALNLLQKCAMISSNLYRVCQNLNFHPLLPNNLLAVAKGLQ